MKRIWFILIPVLLLVFAVFFVSCDFILPAPLGRNNPYDDEAQIGRFNAAVAGSDSIITAWDWRGPIPGIDDKRIIDKIRIVHSNNNPPDSKYPLNPDNVIELDSNSTWQHEWNGLKVDREHHFALYAHEAGGIWLAPKRISQHLDNNGHEERWNIMTTGVIDLYVNTSVDTNLVTATIMNVIAPLSTIGFFRFDDLYYNDFGAVLEAQIQDWTITSGGDFLIVPMRRRVEDGMTWGEIADAGFYDFGNAKAATVNFATDVVDIKDQINIARLHGSNTIAFLSDTLPFDVDISTLDFNNGSDDTFSVWRNN